MRFELNLKVNIYRNFLVFIILFALGNCYQNLNGQALDLKRYGPEEGLSEGYIYTIVQDDNDFLWIGTGNGIFRFDGELFTQFTTLDSLSEDLTTSSLKDSNGNLWFGHFEGGVTRYKNGGFKRALPKGTLTSSIIAIQEGLDGSIWAASQAEGLVRIDSNLNIETFQDGFKNEIRIFSFQITQENEIFLGTEDGLKEFTYKGGNLSFVRDVAGIPLTKVQSMIPRKDGGLWIGTEDEGIFKFIPGKKSKEEVIQSLSGDSLYGIENVYSILEDTDRKLWLGTFGNGVLPFMQKYEDRWLSPILPYLETDTLGDDVIKSIYQDRFGQIWAGTYGNGLLCISEKTFAQYQLGADTNTNNVHAVFQDSNKDFWFGTKNGLHKVNQGVANSFGDVYSLSGIIPLESNQVYNTENGLPSDDITAIAQDDQGKLWVGTKEHGVAYLDEEQDLFIPITHSQQTLGKRITDLDPVGNSQIWIGTIDGAYLYDENRQEGDYFGTRNGIAHNNIYDLFVNSDNVINIATHTNRIAQVINDDIIEIVVSDTGEIPNINCMEQDGDGAMWYGSDGMGLYHSKGNPAVSESITTEDGLVSNYCYQIVIDRFANVWTTHRSGFSRYIPRTGTAVPYLNKDHFDFVSNEVFSSLLDRKGNIWFGTANGIIRYNWIPTRTRVVAPYIQIEGLEVEDKYQAASAPLDLPYGEYLVRFHFVGLTFMDQKEVVYQVKLEGRDDEWSEITRKTSVTFQGLSDGTYTFKVRARNKFGNWNEVPATYTFSIAPPWWKTWWFRILVLLSVAGLIFAFFKYRLYRLKKEKEELEGKVKDRTRELQEEKKKLEVANLELEKLSLVASETDNAVFIIDRNGKLEWVNPGFSRLTGYSFDEIAAMQQGDSFLDLSSNSDISRLLDEVVVNNSSVQYESRLPSKSGEPIWVISTLTPILDEKGVLRKIVIIDSNITERKEAEEKVRKLNEKLEQLVADRTQELAEANRKLLIENKEHIKTGQKLKKINKELDTFVYRASHDLKGPLASLLGLVGIARAELEDNPSAIRYLDLMKRRGQRLDNILVDLIEATQVKQSPLEFQSINLFDEAQRVVDLLKGKYENVNTSFVLDIDPELNAVTDRNMLRAVLQNYIENSHRYRDEEKEKCFSKISIRIENGDICIKVEDNGTGIPPQAKEKMFEMFYRGTNNISGSGLGLYIVRQAVDKLYGNVSMDSEYGKGSTFMASIPNLPTSRIGETVEEEI